MILAFLLSLLIDFTLELLDESKDPAQGYRISKWIPRLTGKDI